MRSPRIFCCDAPLSGGPGTQNVRAQQSGRTVSGRSSLCWAAPQMPPFLCFGSLKTRLSSSVEVV